MHQAELCPAAAGLKSWESRPQHVAAVQALQTRQAPARGPARGAGRGCRLLGPAGAQPPGRQAARPAAGAPACTPHLAGPGSGVKPCVRTMPWRGVPLGAASAGGAAGTAGCVPMCRCQGCPGQSGRAPGLRPWPQATALQQGCALRMPAPIRACQGACRAGAGSAASGRARAAARQPGRAASDGPGCRVQGAFAAVGCAIYWTAARAAPVTMCWGCQCGTASSLSCGAP